MYHNVCIRFVCSFLQKDNIIVQKYAFLLEEGGSTKKRNTQSPVMRSTAHCGLVTAGSLKTLLAPGTNLSAIGSRTAQDSWPQAVPRQTGPLHWPTGLAHTIQNQQAMRFPPPPEAHCLLLTARKGEQEREAKHGFSSKE